MMAPVVLRATGLTKTFHVAGQPLTVLNDVDVTVTAGESVAIVGPSGSGKSTFLGIAAGLDQPTSGEAELVGKALGGLSEDQRAAIRRDHVGFVFQAFQLIPTLTAFENVLAPADLAGKQADQRALDLLKQVGLSERLHHYPKQLSGGEQQRVAIARAFINEPDILFADEPTGNLDSTTGQAIEDMLFALNASHGTTLIVVTHNHELALRADRTVVFRSGRVVACADDNPKGAAQ